MAVQAKSVTPAEVGCRLGTWAAVLTQCNQSTGDCQQCGSDGRVKPLAGTGIICTLLNNVRLDIVVGNERESVSIG